MLNIFQREFLPRVSYAEYCNRYESDCLSVHLSLTLSYNFNKNRPTMTQTKWYPKTPVAILNFLSPDIIMCANIPLQHCRC